MIVKKVPTSKQAAPKSKALSVRALVDYIAGLKAGGDSEKVEHRGALNFLNLDHDGQVQEMTDLADLAKRSPQPVQHWILSWREGEKPTAAQAEEAVGMFMCEMGLGEHQVVYALHRDTKNCHVHIAVNRVHPETERVVTVNNGFDHEVAHRAIARIEQQQGWQPEERALFLARNDGELERRRSREERVREPSTPARDFEERAGERSAERIALEVAAPIIHEARSWEELHRALAREGIQFQRKGSGAILRVDSEMVKASSAGRECSIAALSKRLGEFQPDVAHMSREPPRRDPEAIEPRSAAWQRYAEERGRVLAERAARRERSAAREREGWRRLAEHHRNQRAEILGGSWRGRGDLLNATRSLLAARQAQEKAELRGRLGLERIAAREFERLPLFREWLLQRSAREAERWRHRERRPPSIGGPTFVAPEPMDIRAFTATVDGGKVHYHRASGLRAPAFTDRGRVIDINANDRASVLAALQLSAQKWVTFTVRGSESFRHLCAELAAEHGFRIANPELQQTITAARSSMRVDHVYNPSRGS